MDAVTVQQTDAENQMDLGGVLIQASHMTADTRDNIDW